MANASALPQFFDEDLANGQLTYKLRTLVRDLELGSASETEAATGGRVLAGEGDPRAGLGDPGDLYLDVSGRFKRVFVRTPVKWVFQGTLALAGGAEANTASNIGDGVGLVHGKEDADLSFKSLVAGGAVQIEDRGDTIRISSLAEVNGGFFPNRLDATTIQLARGARANLPILGRDGEPFFTTDTQELFVGLAGGMVALQVAPENVAGLLEDGKIKDEYLQGGTRPQVYVVADTFARDQLDAVESDVAILDRVTYIYDGEQWHNLSQSVTGDGDITVESSDSSLRLAFDPLYTAEGTLIIGADGELIKKGNMQWAS